MSFRTNNTMMTDGGANALAEKYLNRIRQIEQQQKVMVKPSEVIDPNADTFAPVATTQTVNPYMAYLNTVFNQGNENINQSADTLLNMYRQQATGLKGAYDDARSNAYVNARVQALGNNEALAAQGLAGNPYTRAKSGTSETARLYQDVAMQNTINSLSQEQRSAVQSLQKLMSETEAKRQQSLGANLADYQKAIADYKLAEENKQYENISKYLAAGGDVGTLTNEQQSVFNRGGVTVEQYQQSVQQSYADELTTLIAQGAADLGIINSYKGKISEEAYNKAVGQYQSIQARSFTAAYDNLTADTTLPPDELNQHWIQYWNDLDTAVKNGEVTEEQRAKLYERDWRNRLPKISSVGDYNKAMLGLDNEKSKLGSHYNTIKAELEKSPYNPANRSDRDINYDRKFYNTTSGQEYTVFDKSNGRGISSTSLSVGENVVVRINGKDTTVALRYYASQKKKDALGDMKVGEIKSHGGYLYLKGQNNVFRLDVSDVEGIKNYF